MDDNGDETQNKSDLDGYKVAPEMDNTEDIGAESSENSGVNDNENIGVDRAGNEMVYQTEESVDNPELGKDNKALTENDKKENVTADEANVESEKESRYNLRDKRTRSYKHLYDPAMFNIGHSHDNKQDEVVLTTANDIPKETAQMSMKKGLRVFGEEVTPPLRRRCNNYMTERSCSR